VLAVLHTRENLPLRGAVAFQLVGDDHPGRILAPFQQLAEELLGRFLVPTAMHQNIQHSTVLIDRPPEIVPFAVNREKHLIQMPLVPWLQTTASQLVGIALTEFTTPFPDGFVRGNDSPGEQQFLNIAIARAEAEIDLHRVADDLGWEAVILVTVDRWAVHTPSMAHQASARQAAQQIDKAHTKARRCRLID
jgi:hypothetical protein